MEGGWQADGKGLSVWDVYTNTDRMAANGETANVALNMYDRAQYLADIALLKELGVNAYRFSLNWPRILPDGTGTPNPHGHRLLPPAHRRPEGGGHRAPGDALSLGAAAGAGRAGRLGQPRRSSTGSGITPASCSTASART